MPNFMHRSIVYWYMSCSTGSVSLLLLICLSLSCSSVKIAKLIITLSVYRSRFEALPSIGSSIFAEHTVRTSNNATDNGHIYARVFVNDCYGLGCAL